MYLNLRVFFIMGGARPTFGAEIIVATPDCEPKTCEAEKDQREFPTPAYALPYKIK